MYPPLHVDEDIEKQRYERPASLTGRISYYCDQVAKWLDRYSPFLLHYELPRGRKSVETQLRRRKIFPATAWERVNCPIGRVERILALLQKRMNWPNCHFLPDDPITLALMEEYDEYASYEFFLDIQDELGAKFSNEEIEELCSLGHTLSELIEAIHNRAHDCGTLSSN